MHIVKYINVLNFNVKPMFLIESDLKSFRTMSPPVIEENIKKN